MRSFREFMALREANESGDSKDKKNKGVQSDVNLKSAGFEPFIVNKSGPRKNLSTLVDAFSKSADIPYGPKKIDKQAAQTTGQKTGGLTRDTLDKKTLYLVGGAVRDHLQNIEANDYDVATDATMDEIRLILQNAGFKETSPQTMVDDDEHAPDGNKYAHLPKSSGGNKIFYVKGTDLKGEEFVMGAKINGEEFEIATFRKDKKGTSDGRATEMEFTPNIEEDAQRRDFTMNAMYIPLTNSNGPNNKLIDFHGGIHDLSKGKVKFVGDAKKRLEEDELRALRYARFASQSGDEPDEDILKAIGDIKDLPSLQPHMMKGKMRDRRGRIVDEFVKGLDKVKKGKISPEKYIGMYRKLGLLNNAVFPGMDIHPEDIDDEKDRIILVASLLRGNDPNAVYDKLIDAKWSKDDAKRVKFLLTALKFHPEMDPEELDRFSTDFSRSGFSTGYLGGQPSGGKSNVAKWITRANPQMGTGMESFLKHMSHGDIKASPDNPEFMPFYTTDIYGKLRGTPGIGAKKRQLAHQRFQDIFSQGQPKNTD
jgi:tRNA nucleotidyltransferase/poly(A) polymerase